jgi:hypothetical protein
MYFMCTTMIQNQRQSKVMIPRLRATMHSPKMPMTAQQNNLRSMR